MRFSLPSIKCSAASPSRSGYCRARGIQIAEHSPDNEIVLDSSRKLGGAAEHLISGSEKRICRLSFEYDNPHVIERGSNCARYDSTEDISLQTFHDNRRQL